jgi:hypothetical protein
VIVPRRDEQTGSRWADANDDRRSGASLQILDQFLHQAEREAAVGP